MFKKTLLLLMGVVYAYLPLIAQDTQTWSVTFDYKQATISQKTEKTLDEILDFMGNTQVTQITLKGHTDNIGTKQNNQELSLQRAKAIQHYLVSAGVDADKISLSGHNFAEPLANNLDPEGRAINRRTEILVQYALKTVQEVKKKKGEVALESSELPPITLLPNDEGFLRFSYQEGRDILIRTDQGSEIRIEAKQFPNPKKLLERPLTIRVREYTNHKRIRKDKVSTFSHGEILRSSGMMFLDLQELGDLNGCVTVFLSANQVEGMRPYITQSTSNLQQINWNPMTAESMIYDADRQGYVFKICGNYLTSNIGINVDKPAGEATLLVKIKNRHWRRPIPSMTFEDGTIANAYQVYKGAKKTRRKYYLIPYTQQEVQVLEGTYHWKGDAYALQEIIPKQMLKPVRKKTRKKLFLNDSNLSRASRTKLRYKKT